MTATSVEALPAVAEVQRPARRLAAPLWVTALLLILTFLVIYPLLMLFFGAVSDSNPVIDGFGKFNPSLTHFIAVLGNERPEASVAGEIIPTHAFYSYEAKYLDEHGAHLKIPAELTDAQHAEVRAMALEAFKALDLAGLARVDFFLEKGTGRFYLNEVNTIPGFTRISMYPKLWEATGVPYAKLVDRLIALALERHATRKALSTRYVR